MYANASPLGKVYEQALDEDIFPAKHLARQTINTFFGGYPDLRVVAFISTFPAHVPVVTALKWCSPLTVARAVQEFNLVPHGTSAAL